MKRSPILVKRGRMARGEKLALVDFYSTFGAEGAVVEDLRDWVADVGAYRWNHVTTLVSRGMLTVFGDWIDMTPQGEAVARMILGLVKRKKRRR